MEHPFYLLKKQRSKNEKQSSGIGGKGRYVGEMRKRGCSEPTALKIWRGEYEEFENFKDNDMNLSNLRKAAFVLKVGTGTLIPK
jgi:phosphoenolpyruvate synthase/pyruvate phosphate dikinase